MPLNENQLRICGQCEYWNGSKTVGWCYLRYRALMQWKTRRKALYTARLDHPEFKLPKDCLYILEHLVEAQNT